MQIVPDDSQEVAAKVHAFRPLQYMQRIIFRRQELKPKFTKDQGYTLQLQRFLTRKQAICRKSKRVSNMSFAVAGSGLPLESACEAMECEQECNDINIAREDSNYDGEPFVQPRLPRSPVSPRFPGRRIAVTTTLAIIGLQVYPYRPPCGDWIWGESSYGMLESVDRGKAQCEVRWEEAQNTRTQYRIGRFGKFDLCTRTEDYFAALARSKKTHKSGLDANESARLIRRGRLLEARDENREEMRLDHRGEHHSFRSSKNASDQRGENEPASVYDPLRHDISREENLSDLEPAKGLAALENSSFWQSCSTVDPTFCQHKPVSFCFSDRRQVTPKIVFWKPPRMMRRA